MTKLHDGGGGVGVGVGVRVGVGVGVMVGVGVGVGGINNAPTKPGFLKSIGTIFYVLGYNE